MKLQPLLLSTLAAVFTLSAASVQAGPIRDRIMQRMQERAAGGESGAADGDLADLGGGNAQSCAEWSKKVNRLQERAAGRNAGPAPDMKDVPYGSHNLEKLDVYLPKPAATTPAAPIILMVHGGGWCVGDKAAGGVVANKVARWGAKGFVFISINYPMVSDGRNALAQAGEVAKATAYVQANAQKWGGDPAKVILMGHSAGAHLVSLVNADPAIRQANSLKPILGVVSLDAGAVDVVKQMPNVYSFLKVRYEEAFGTTEAQWITASPFHKLERSAAPWLGVCSSKRKDDPCGQAQAYADKSKGLGVKAAVLPEAKGHGAINKELGQPGEYTSGVEAFMASLDPVVGGLLGK